MALEGIGSNQSVNSNKTSNLNGNVTTKSETTIWANFNDDNNIVDISDVSYIENNGKILTSSDIKSFLEVNKGKEWTESLKNQLNRLISQFNLECEGEALADELDNLEEHFNTFRNNAEKEFETFKEDENGKFINFTSKIKNEKDEFVKESVNKVIEDLKGGYDGYISFNEIGTVTYNKDQNSFVLERKNGQLVTLNDEKLKKIIDLAVEHGNGIRGESKIIETR